MRNGMQLVLIELYNTVCYTNSIDQWLYNSKLVDKMNDVPKCTSFLSFFGRLEQQQQKKCHSKDLNSVLSPKVKMNPPTQPLDH